jgi:hypothetical protein
MRTSIVTCVLSLVALLTIALFNYHPPEKSTTDVVTVVADDNFVSDLYPSVYVKDGKMVLEAWGNLITINTEIEKPKPIPIVRRDIWVIGFSIFFIMAIIWWRLFSHRKINYS